MSALGRCAECNGSVFWAVTPKGARIALNVLPVMVAIGDPTASEDAEPVALIQARSIHFDTCAKRDPRTRR